MLRNNERAYIKMAHLLKDFIIERLVRRRIFRPPTASASDAEAAMVM
jgi:hypothetical protein